MAPERFEHVRSSFARQGLMRTLGALLEHVDDGTCTIRARRLEGTQQSGFLHAGVMAALADTAGGYAAYTLMEPSDEVLTVEFKMNFLIPARGSELIGRGRVLRAGRRLFVCEIDAFSVERGEQLCARGLQTVTRHRTRPSPSTP